MFTLSIAISPDQPLPVQTSNSIINSNAKEFKVESVETFKISNDKNKNSDVDICYHRSNTFAKIVRGSKISTCLELDIIIEKDEIYINHPPKKEKFIPYFNLIGFQD